MESRYKITCLRCNGERIVKIVKTPIGSRIDWLEEEFGISHKIVSGRERLDQQFGWQCLCGNNDLLTRQESKQFSNPVAPKPQEINDIVKNLKPDKPKFEMVGV